MKEEDKLRQKFGSDTGFRVPEGYFDSVFDRISAELPKYTEAQTVKSLSRWQRIKPYVYLAAMFGGIWCTMKMVNHVSSASQQEVSLDNPPAMVAQAMQSPEVLAQSVGQPSVMVVEDYDGEDLDMFEEDTNPSGEEVSKADELEVADPYSEFMDIDDINLGELQAALQEDDEDYYAYL